MTSDTEPSPQDPLLRQRCSDYLLGEMTPQQAARFESELDSPALSQALIRESELLCRVAQSQVAQSANMTSDGIGPAPRSLPAPAAAQRTTTLQRIAIVISALAATIVLISLASMHGPGNQIERNATALKLKPATPSASFEFELAKTWVQPAVDWDSTDWDSTDWDSTDWDSTDWAAGVEVASDPIEEDTLQADFGDAVSDETFSWMVVALEAAIGEDDRNDG